MIKELTVKNTSGESKKHQKRRELFIRFLEAVREVNLPESIIDRINEKVEKINTTQDTNEVHKLLYKERVAITALLEKELKIIPKGYYRTRWMAIGMVAFGLPMGVAFGAALGNMAFLAIGMPVGLAIGLAMGSGMDAKAAEEGRQLNIELN